VALSLRVNITSNIDANAIPEVLQRLVVPGVQKAAGKVRDDAKDIISAAGRVDKGTMRNATQAETARVQGNRVVARVVNDAEHAIYQHDGTRGPILPRRARVLRFTPKGGGGFVYARQVRGVEGIQFLTKALERLRTSDFG
jgi:hypothetical protein